MLVCFYSINTIVKQGVRINISWWLICIVICSILINYIILSSIQSWFKISLLNIIEMVLDNSNSFDRMIYRSWPHLIYLQLLVILLHCPSNTPTPVIYRYFEVFYQQITQLMWNTNDNIKSRDNISFLYSKHIQKMHRLCIHRHNYAL